MNAEVTIDTGLVGEQGDPFQSKPASEKRADQFAAEVSIPREELDNFVASVRPLYSAQVIRKFAITNAVHPRIVMGKLQHRREISYAHSRNLLVKVRDIVTSSSFTGGWGYCQQRLSKV